MKDKAKILLKAILCLMVLLLCGIKAKTQRKHEKLRNLRTANFPMNFFVPSRHIRFQLSG